MSSERKNQTVVDGIAEIFEEIIKLLVKVISFLLEKVIQIITEKIADNKRGYSKIDIRYARKTNQSNDEKSLGISIKSRRKILYEDLNTSLHSFVAGASGFGKTVLMMILQDRAVEKGNTVIFIDPKGDYQSIQDFRKICAKHDRKCVIFSDNNLSPFTFNPFRNGTKTQVAERIMDSFHWSEQFYRDYCYSTLLDVLSELERCGKVFSLHSILDVYEQKYLNDKNRSLFIKLKSVSCSDFGNSFRDDHATDTYTFERAREEKACIYIGLSAQAYNEIAYAVGKFFLGELLQLSYETLKNNKANRVNSLCVFFDEFGSVVTNRFIELLNKCRAAKIELYMAVQSIADIDKVDQNLKNQIIENTANIFVFKQRLDSSASFFSQAIGTIESKEYTQQIGEDGKKGGRSEKIVYEHIVHPDLIKSLSVGQCVLLRQNPMKVDLINVRKLVLPENYISNKIPDIKPVLDKSKNVFEVENDLN